MMARLITIACSAWLAVACGEPASSNPDAGAMRATDSGAPDGGDALGRDAMISEPSDAGTDAMAVPPVGSLPGLLSETGLYTDTAAKTLAGGVRAYEVNSPLWADTASKERFILLPPDTQIDTSDMDQWVFPEGTKLWKSFERDGKRLETRLIQKLPGGQWEMLAYQWDADETEATAVPKGVENAGGSTHDIPEVLNCKWCHDGRADRVLGFTALQLSHDLPGPNLMRLAEEGLLTDPPAAPFQYPGDAVTRPALQYMHANCGHCHNPTRSFALGCSRALASDSAQCEGLPDNPPAARGQVVLFFWQSVRELDSFEQTITYKSLLVHDSFSWPSAITDRMSMRGGDQMPPVATEHVDPDGLAAVEAWVESLKPLFPSDEDAGSP